MMVLQFHLLGYNASYPILPRPFMKHCETMVVGDSHHFQLLGILPKHITDLVKTTTI